MITTIREVRRAKGLTLADVAARCVPPTTAQTIGRLETGMRTVSVDWLNRIAAALDVEPASLVTLDQQATVPVIATLDGNGAAAPLHAMAMPAPMPDAGDVAIRVTQSQGDYRAGDVLWCRRVAASDGLTACINRDVIMPMRAGRFLFGRLIRVSATDVEVLPATGEQRAMVTLPVPAWLAVVRLLIREAA